MKRRMRRDYCEVCRKKIYNQTAMKYPYEYRGTIRHMRICRSCAAKGWHFNPYGKTYQETSHAH